MALITSPRFWFLVVFLVVLGGVVWVVGFREPAKAPQDTPPANNLETFDDIHPDPSPEDPRLAYSGPFRNVKPDIKFVGDQVCTECHTDICNTYHAHPMGRSAEFMNNASPLEKYDGSANNPCKSGVYTLDVTKTPDGLKHRMTAKLPDGTTLPEYTTAANLAIGSGTRGRSYVSIENGSVWQSPISWFSSENKWDVSPGFDLGAGGRRPIIAGCLICHVNNVDAIQGTVNTFKEPLLGIQASIGCERCHGPGDLHAKERKVSKPSGKIDHSIVNPKHLAPDLQTSICKQCHLQGQERVRRRGRNESEFRPGLPFDQFITVFVRHADLADTNRSVGQFEQMAQSSCKTSSGGKLLCTSCHDPHKVPTEAEKEGYYRNTCQKCHESKGCIAPSADRKAKNDSCIACHMPKGGSSNIAHASVTDHRILRRPSTPTPPKGVSPGESPLAIFEGGSVPADEIRRDMGIALARLTAALPQSGSKQMLGAIAKERLSVSLQTWRGDADAWLAMAKIDAAIGDRMERWKSAERAVKLDPDSEHALAELADAAMVVKKYDRALEAATRLVQRHPRSIDHWVTRGNIYSAMKEWQKAADDSHAALKIQPLHVQSRLILAGALLRTHGADEADKEFEIAMKLITKPNQKSLYRDWYERERSLSKNKE